MSADRYSEDHLFGPGILADWQIAELAEHHAMIDPFEPSPVRYRLIGHDPDGEPVYDQNKVVSYGLGHYGYDMRVADEFKVFSNLNTCIVDPKRTDSASYHEVQGDCIIPPNSFALARSLERFKIPRDVIALVIGKSTYARCGVIVNCTPLEPEWEGYVTLEISNTTPLPARIYGNEGLAQVLFYRASGECRTSYRDKGGKYQNQPPKIVLPRM